MLGLTSRTDEKRFCHTAPLTEVESPEQLPPARKEKEGLRLSPGDPFISAAAVGRAAAELEPALDGVGGAGEEVPFC